MDEYTGQRTAGGLAISRRGSGISFRDSTDESRNIQNCNRLRCGTRLNSVKGINTSNPEKGKYSKPSFHSLSSKTSVGSSTKSFAGMSDHRKLNQEQRKPASLTVIAESSSKQVLEDAKLVPSTSGIQIKRIEPEDVETAVRHSLSMNRTDKEVINTRPQKQMQQSGLVNKNTATGSSVRRSLSSRISSQAGKSTSQNQGASTPRYGLRNLGCSSINDVLSSGSSTDSSGRRISMIKKRCPDGESSSSRSKKIGGSSSGLGSQGNALSSQSLSPADISTPQPTSRRTRNWSLGSSSDAPVRARRVISGDTSMRLSASDGDNGFSISRHMVIPQLPETEISINETTLGRSSQSTLTEQPSICLNSFRQSGPINGTVRSRPITHPEDSSTHPFHRLSLERDGFRRFNMEGIAEVLLALERIEHDEELTYEQLLVLESNLFLGGPGVHDQHRDMRLDIDNMSYEELLALEEKMGTVSTALTEEELSNCLKRSCYMPALMIEGIAGCGDDDTKCSICQEEYVVGDEVGKLGCDHRYHAECIFQWLQQKNWCPICKISALVS